MFVILPIFLDSFGHSFSGHAQPIGFSPMKVSQDIVGAAASQVYVGNFRAHGVKKYFFIALLCHASYLNRIRIWGKATNYSFANGFLEWIAGANRIGHSLFIV